MKSEHTIRCHIRNLKRICEDPNTDEKTRGEAYESYHALRWVIEDVSWTPTSLARSSLAARGVPR